MSFIKKSGIVVALIAMISALTFNEINIHWMEKDGIELRDGETIITADDASYIRPAVNLLETGELKNSAVDKGAYFLRPPGYPLVIALFGGEHFFALKLFQLALFGLSVYCLFILAYHYLNSFKWAVLVSAIYGITPIASSFIYYTLSEGITPPLVILFIYFLELARNRDHDRKKALYYLFSALIFSYLFITRPVLGIFIFALPVYLISDYWHQKKQLAMHLLLNGVVALTPMLFWQIRNANIANEYVGLHPIYYSEHSGSCFRPPHEALWKFCKGWGEKGSDYHGYIVPFWKAAINRDTSAVQREKVIEQFPSDVVSYFGKARLDDMLKSYQVSILHQRRYYYYQEPMPKEIPPSELEAIAKMDALTAEFKSHFWFQYYIASPLKVYRGMAFHSNLSLYIFQHPLRGNFIIESYRLFCFSIHALAFILLPFSLLMRKPQRLKMVFSYILIAYLYYLAFVQRGVEERYTLPVLGLLLISSAGVVQDGIRWLHKRFFKGN